MTGEPGQPATASAEGVSVAVALVTACGQDIAELSQADIIGDVPAADVVRSLVVLTAAVLRALTPDEGERLLRSVGQSSAEIAAARAARRWPDA
jgi:hypothetical protein